MRQKKEETNVKRWGLQVQKVGIVEETRGEVAGTELRWQHGMGNRTKYKILINSCFFLNGGMSLLGGGGLG